MQSELVSELHQTVSNGSEQGWLHSALCFPANLDAFPFICLCISLLTTLIPAHPINADSGQL